VKGLIEIPMKCAESNEINRREGWIGRNPVLGRSDIIGVGRMWARI
jgi:hypothetical protein